MFPVTFARQIDQGQNVCFPSPSFKKGQGVEIVSIIYAQKISHREKCVFCNHHLKYRPRKVAPVTFTQIDRPRKKVFLVTFKQIGQERNCVFPIIFSIKKKIDTI